MDTVNIFLLRSEAQSLHKSALFLMQITSNLSIYIARPDECHLSGKDTDFESSMRAAIHRVSNAEEAVSPGKADVVLICQDWKSRNWHDINDLGKSIFLLNYSHKCLVISHDDFATCFLPGLYVSLTSRSYWPRWSVPSGYKRQYQNLDADYSMLPSNKSYLFSFRGNDFSHPVRKKLSRLFNRHSSVWNYTLINKPFNSHSREEYIDYIQEMLQSKFILAPRGLSPSSYRLYEAMQYARCPIIISDDWQPVPGIDWHRCSIRVSEKDVKYLPDILNERRDEASLLGSNARHAWLNNFSIGKREDKMIADIISLHASCTMNRDMRCLSHLWRSRRFYRAHGWSLSQRLSSKIKSTCRSKWFKS